MPTRSDAPELAVDELKRRARRRLVGAIVLALAAAVILPFLLESDPKPLGDEVSIRIPPIDNGRFINPLTPGKGSDGAAPGSTVPKAEPKPGAVITPKKSIAEAERRVMGQGAVQPAPGPTITPPATVPPAAEAPTPSPSPAADKAGSPEPKADATAAPSLQTAANGAYSVQVGAFADTKVAADLTAELKASGFATFTETVPTTQGSVQRVRVGPFATRGAADAALAKLKLAGYDRALVTISK